ncbi:hypothetical protein [Streptomyces atroolivaceus]|uniref:Uncharacterized protein n=1 Tax=Streptomyces atroolivaceus TaxID=66869 RepID=A0ABV9VGZ6_STRAZ|nr:hypothetical protein [Streptomyces atroolivaceus]
MSTSLSPTHLSAGEQTSAAVLPDQRPTLSWRPPAGFVTQIAVELKRG